MRAVLLNAVLCAASVAANVAVTRPAEPAAQPLTADAATAELRAAIARRDAAVADGKRIVAREIVLVDEDGKARVTILAGKHGSGIWIGDQSSPLNGGTISLFNVPGQGPSLGIYSPGGGRIGDGCDFAVSAGRGGPVQIQVRKADGKLDWLDAGDLKK